MSSCHVWKFEHAYIKQLTPQDPATREKRNQVDLHIAAIAQAIQARLAQNNTHGTVCVSDANHIVAEPGHDSYAVGGSKWRTEIRIPVGAAEDSTALEYALSCLLEQESMTLSTNESESHPAKVVGYWTERAALYLDIAFLVEGSREAFAVADRAGQPYVYSFIRDEMQKARTGLGKRDDWGPDSWVSYNMQRIGRWPLDGQGTTRENP